MATLGRPIQSTHTLLEVLDVAGGQGDTNAVDPINAQMT